MRARLSTSGRWLKKWAAVTARPLHYRTSFLCGLCVLCASAFNSAAQTNFAAYWNFSQILPPTQMKRHEVSLTPLFQFTSNGTNLFIGGQTNQYFTDTNNVLVVSNLLPGFRYAVTYKPVADPFYGSKNILFTNVFPSSLTNGAYVNGADPAYLAATTNSSDTSVAANSVFLQRRNDTGSNMTFVGTLELPPGTGQVGYVWTMTDQATGAGEYQAAQGGSSGAATNVYRSQVSGSGLTISTNTLTLIYTFALSASLQGWANWTTNTFGALFDLAGAGTTAATAATNALGLSSGLAAFRSTNTFDVSGAATAATNALGLASSLAAFRATNTFDVAGAATAATNGYPWGSLYDAAGTALAATNNFRDGRNLTNLLHSSTVSGVSGVSVALTQNADGSTNFGLTVTASGSGDFSGPASSVADNFVSFNGTSGKAGKDSGKSAASFDLSGAALAATNGIGIASGVAAFRSTNTFITPEQLGIGSNNVNAANLFGTLPHGTLLAFILTNNWQGTLQSAGLRATAGFTNDSLTASTLTKSDANKKMASIANGVGVLTNDASGNFGFTPMLDASALKASQYVATDGSTNLVSTQNGFNWTNLNTHFTNYGLTTNIVLPADGNDWTVLATNGPHVFLNFGGNNMGTMSIWVTTNGDTAWPAQVTMLGYSNHLTTNCIIDLKPWGGTNRVLGGQSEL